MMNFKKVTVLTLLSGFFAINAGFAMQDENNPPVKQPPVKQVPVKQEPIKVPAKKTSISHDIKKVGAKVEDKIRKTKKKIKKLF